MSKQMLCDKLADNNALPEDYPPTPPLSQHFALECGVSDGKGKREAERGNSKDLPSPLPPAL